VFADEDKTSEIVKNLLSNAIKYNKQGGKIVVSAMQENDKVKVSVEDTGIGIAEKDMPKMFDKFFRTDEAVACAQGTGLGLPVTKGLVEGMGEELALKSRHGEGSNFSFTLPKRKQEVRT
jgi:signal transduction histidine kinase